MTSVSSFSPPLRPAARCLLDAHESWHDAVDSYHDPYQFRRHAESLVQSLRNVTFRVQAAKDEIGHDFDSWYEDWRTVFQNDRLMSCLNDARVDVVHRAGLRSNSFAMVRVVDSYLSPEAWLFSMGAETSTQELVRRARGTVPEDVRRHVAIEVARRWVSPSFPDEELLSALSHCWRILDACVSYADATYNEVVLPSPGGYLAEFPFADFVGIDPSEMLIAFKCESGEQYAFDLELEESLASEDAGSGLGADVSNLHRDVGALVRQLHDHARQVYLQSGFHAPLAFLTRHGQPTKVVLVETSDKRDKFMKWRQIGRIVERKAFEAFAFTSESWVAPMPDDVDPFADAETLAGAEEYLVTYGECHEGRNEQLASRIERSDSTVTLGGPETWQIDRAHVMFAQPVRRVWESWSAREPT